MTSNAARLGGESIIKDATGTVPRWRLLYQPDGDIDLIRCDSSGVAQETVLNLDGTTGTLTLADVGALTSTGLLTVGDASGSPEIRLSKSETGTDTITFYSASVRRMQIELSTTENGAIRTYDSAGALVATTTIINSSCGWQFPATITVAGIATFNGGVQPIAVAVAPAADAAAAITSTTSRVVVSTASGANTAISTSSSYNGQRISLQMTAAAGGGSYTLAVTGGTLTLDAANETALIERIGSAWVVLSLNGATVV